ncbi:MAG: hypothetical protein SF051_13295 [Elusimicrobiota bacterium]|nr:hypothetical protein [Elusimicrobiota bacterium]
MPKPVKKKSRPAAKAKAPTVPTRTPVWDISPEEQLVGAPLVGKVRAYDAKTREMTVRLEEPLSAGDQLRVKGKVTDLTQRAEHIRVGRRAVQSALPGETAFVAVADAVRPGDAVWKL